MGRQCFFTGKKTQFGIKKTTRGKAKYLGGVGTKITGLTRRKVKPNLQKVRALVDGKIVRVLASTSAIRSGLVEKPIVHQPFTLDREKAKNPPKGGKPGEQTKSEKGKGEKGKAADAKTSPKAAPAKTAGAKETTTKSAKS
ncbi:MAG TPA: L28 family ribosomal protein [Pirellulaceae bacterium]|jgi:large subunit ribosomal protein L28|nr:L28 family ribosomal protein [Pirellulaceae bacterium]